MPSPHLNRPISPRALLALLAGLNLFNYLDRYVLGAVLVPLQTELGLDDGAAGRINTAFMIGYFVTSPIFGFLGDRYSRKWLIAAGIAVWSLGTVLTGVAGGLVALIACRIIVGVGEASYATISPSLISDAFPSARRNNALTFFYLAIPVGAAAGYLVGGLIGAQWGWRHAFIWAGVPGLLLALALLPFAEPVRGGADGTNLAQRKPRASDVLQLFAIPEFVLLVLGYTAYTFALGAFSLWGPSFLQRVHGVAQSDAATFFSGVLFVAGLVGTLLGGLLATKWQKKNPAGYASMLGFSVLAAVPASLGAFAVEETWLAMSLLALAMLLLFLSTGPVNTLILELVPAELRASAMALSIFAIHLGGDMWSPEIVGRLSDAWQSLRSAVLILPVALLVSALFWLWLAWRQRRAARAA